jgi:diacylglycerol kinase (CTP)
MSLPANDASSYGLTHDSPSSPMVNSFMPHSRARRASLSAMSSTSSTSSYSSSGSSPKTKPSGGTTRHARKASKEKRVTFATTTSNGSANGNITPKGTFWATFIDRWEVPRKTLHSSIGKRQRASCSFPVTNINTFFSGFVTLSLYSAAQGAEGSGKPIVKALLTAFAAIAPLDVIRLKYPAFERAYEYAVGFLMRESEKVIYLLIHVIHSLSTKNSLSDLQNASNGVIWYLIGCSFVLYAYPLDVAVVAILMFV